MAGAPKTLPSVPVRGTQSFVGVLAATRKRPALTALEIAWRWSLGIPVLLLTYVKLVAALNQVTAGTLDPGRLGLDPVLLNDPVGALSADPSGAAGKVAHAVALVWPAIAPLTVWLVPLSLIAWVVQSAVGRTLLLTRMDPALRARPLTLAVLHTVRVASLAAVYATWFLLVRWGTRTLITNPIAQHAEPDLVPYCGLIIVASLTLFTGWAAVNWIVNVAPLLAMRDGLDAVASLGAALRLGPMRGKLVEINLVLGIVKIALLVLAMVFSACPLPFETFATADFMREWWAAVILFYLVASDFFHVARLRGYLELLRAYKPIP